MNVSFYSVLMSVFWSSLGVFILYRCLKRRWFIRRFGIQMLCALYLLCGLRLFFPVEIKGVKVISLDGALASAYEVVGLQKAELLGMEISALQVCGGIWIVGAVFFVMKWSWGYFRGKRSLQRLLEHSKKQESGILEQIQKQYGHAMTVEVWKSAGVDIPMGVGIFKKRILIPDKDYSRQQLSCILCHEYTHFRNRDIETKLLLQLLCCVFWWNPCSYLLLREIDQILEIRCDLAVIKAMGKKEKSVYLETILRILQEGMGRDGSKTKLPSAMLFQQGKNHEVLERFQIVKDAKESKRSIIGGCAAAALLCFLLCGSYLFQFQAAFPPPEVEGGVTETDIYLIDNKDGTYTIVMKDKEREGKIKKRRYKYSHAIQGMIEQGVEVRE